MTTILLWLRGWEPSAFVSAGLMVGWLLLVWGVANLCLSALWSSLEKEGRYVGGICLGAVGCRRPDRLSLYRVARVSIWQVRRLIRSRRSRRVYAQYHPRIAALRTLTK